MSQCQVAQTNAISQCPTAPDLQQDFSESQLATVLSQLGIQSCRTTSGAFINALPPVVAVASSTMGCEQVSVVAQKINKLTAMISCMIQKIVNCSYSGAKIDQLIDVDLSGSEVLCDLNLKQKATLAVVNVSDFSNQMKSEVTNKVEDVVKTMIEKFQESKSEFLSTPQGNKSFNIMNNNIQNIVNSASVSDVINNAITEVYINQTMKFKCNNCVIKGRMCTFDQEALATVAAQNAVSNMLSNILKNESVTEFTTQLKEYQKTEGTGPKLPDLFGGLGGIIAIVVVVILVFAGGFLIMGKNLANNAMKYAIPIGIAVTIIIVVIAVIAATKKKSFKKI